MSELRDFEGLFRLDGKVALITGGEFHFTYASRTKQRDSTLKKKL